MTEYKLRDGSIVQDQRLDRLEEFDNKSRKYPIRALHAGKRERSYTWRCNLYLDQGNLGSCVGNGITHELAARPAEVKGLTEQFAVKKIYWPAQREDNFPGGAYPGASPRYEGTSVLAGIRVAQALGYFDEYRWAFSLEDLIMGVGHNGPAVCGFRWREGMMKTDSNGFVHATGEEVGGHCVLVRAVNIKKQYFTIRNSWGTQWGWGGDWGGDCKISFSDMELLLNSRADAAFFLHRHCEGRPTNRQS